MGLQRCENPALSRLQDGLAMSQPKSRRMSAKRKPEGQRKIDRPSDLVPTHFAALSARQIARIIAIIAIGVEYDVIIDEFQHTASHQSTLRIQFLRSAGHDSARDIDACDVQGDIRSL